MTATFSYSTDASVTVLEARAVSDGVGELAARLAECLDARTDAGCAVVLAASSSSAEALARRLDRTLGAAADAARVVSVREFALELLDSPEAFDATGRRARMLSGFDLAFLNEDIGVLGMRGRRIREMLKFLERGWSELREEEPDWLVTGEEMAVERHVKSRLAFMEALHPAEVEAMCVRYLAGSAEARERVGFDRVFVADARSMSRAGQILACMVARRELTVVWNVDAALRGDAPYAYEDGLTELLGANPSANIVVLDSCSSSRAVRDVLANLAAARGGDAPAVCADSAPAGSFEAVDAGMLEDEMASVVEAVRAAVDAGIATEGIFVACPNDAWVRRARNALVKAGIRCTSIEERQVLNCDVRDAGKSVAARAYTALLLAANPRDCAAWRAWCGFGDYLALSGAFDALARWSGESGSNLADALAALEAAEKARADGSSGAGVPDAPAVQGADRARLLERYRSGIAFVKKAAQLVGDDLVAAACDAAGSDVVPAALVGLLGKVDTCEGASALVKRSAKGLVAPTFADAGVRVGSWERLLGLAPHTVVFCGMVNGLVPEQSFFDLTQLSVDARAKARERLLERMVAAVSHVTNGIVCTTFSRAGLVEAETLKLDSERIQLVEGRRVCRISPSLCIGLMRGDVSGGQGN